MKPEFIYNSDNHTAMVILHYQNLSFMGTANCHEDDFDMANEKTGCTIALMRAEIEYFQHIKNNELRPRLKAYQDFYNDIKNSKHFNPNSYESKKLLASIHTTTSELTTIKQMIAEKKQELKTYIDEKDKFYKRIRANRAKTDKDAN